MFTGIIEEKGTVASVKKGTVSSRITFRASVVLEDIHEGDSIAVNGVCLTATDITSDTFTADVMAETMRRSSLGSLKTGDHVNMERAMLCGGRFGGHIVSGHIDGTGTVTAINNDGIAVWYTISAKPEIMRYIVEKGSIAIDGISLTVAKVSSGGFSVSIIPHTASQTILSEKKCGDTVNLENDIIAKYVEKLTQPRDTGSDGSITLSLLASNGFI